MFVSLFNLNNILFHCSLISREKKKKNYDFQNTCVHLPSGPQRPSLPRKWYWFSVSNLTRRSPNQITKCNLYKLQLKSICPSFVALMHRQIHHLECYCVVDPCTNYHVKIQPKCQLNKVNWKPNNSLGDGWLYDENRSLNTFSRESNNLLFYPKL